MKNVISYIPHQQECLLYTLVKVMVGFRRYIVGSGYVGVCALAGGQGYPRSLCPKTLAIN